MSPWVEERALAFAVHVICGLSENTSTCRLGALKECVDLNDTKHDGVRPGTLKWRTCGVGVSAWLGDDDGAVAVRELTPMVADAQTYGECQDRREPRDCFAYVGVVQDGYYGAVRC